MSIPTKAGKRWVLLQHIGAPDDPLGVHFDLLLEDVKGCRTWRLNRFPLLDGSPQVVTSLPLHDLTWLEKKDSVVSRGRGHAIQVLVGFFQGELPSVLGEPIAIELNAGGMKAHLEIHDNLCSMCAL